MPIAHKYKGLSNSIIIFGMKASYLSQTAQVCRIWQ